MKRMLLALLTTLVACGPAGSPPGEESTMERRPINDVLASNAERLMAYEGIQGIAVGETPAGEPCLLIFATVPAAQLSEVVGDSLEGWPVRIESGDEIRPMH